MSIREEKSVKLFNTKIYVGFLRVNVKERIRSNSIVEKSGRGTSLMQRVAQNILKGLE